MVQDRTDYADRATFETRAYISSAPLDIERLAAGVRGHWGVESAPQAHEREVPMN